MADIIRVTPEELRRTSGEMETIAQEIDKTAKDMLQTVGGISQNIWGGEAASKFINKFNGLNSVITRMRKRLSDQTDHLNKIASMYETSESANKTEANKIRNDIL